MPAKPGLPPIDDELSPRPRLDLPRLDLRGIAPRAALDDAAVEANSRTLGARWGASTSLDPSPPPPSPEPPAPVAYASLRLEVPAYLDQALTVRAAEQRVTKAFLVLSALAQAGYPVDSGDLVPDRRRSRRP